MSDLSRMTTEEAARALTKAQLALMVVGSCEQHGPHLSLDTDTSVAEAIARKLAARLGDTAVVCPTIGYGLSEHHLAFPGTLTLRPSTFLALFADLFESLEHNGIHRVLIVNGHGGNIDALRLAARSARRDRGMLVASIMWATLAADVAAELGGDGIYGHACEVETSVALALVPDRVRLERIGDPGRRFSVDPLTDPPKALVDESVWLDQWTVDGALGDPRRADAEAGRRVVDAVLDRAEAFARRLAERKDEGR